MTGFVSRKAQDPTTWFVSSSYLIHFGVLVSAFYAGDGMNTLLNPAGIVMVSFGAAYSATAGPPIHRATGSLWTASWQTIGVPFAIVGVGIPTAIAIEATDHSPIIRAMFFAPWWMLFIAVTLWQHASGKKAEHPPGSSVFGVAGTWIFLLTRLGILTFLMTLVTVISLTP